MLKYSNFKWLILFVIIIAMWRINERFEIFAMNSSKLENKHGDCFRVMTLNVNTTSSLQDVERFKAELIDEIDRNRPDLLCLQELVPVIFNQIQTSMDSLFGYTDSMKIKKDRLRWVLYSKKPIRTFKRYRGEKDIDTIDLDSIIIRKELPISIPIPVYSAEIEVKPDKWITVFSCHLRSSAYTTARRSMDKDASWIDGLPLYFRKYKEGQQIRNWQAKSLRLHLEALEAVDTPVIIAGDFNDWSGSYCMNTIRDGKYKDAWWEGGFGFGITYHGWNLKLRLDHILYSHHFKLKNVYVEKSKFSDHRPLIADFIFKKDEK